MARVLVTGMSGAGKSTVLAELGRRGVTVVDTDDGRWTGDDGCWDPRRMDDLLAGHGDLVVSGTVDDQGRFYDRFEPLLRARASAELDGRRPVAELADAVEVLVASPLEPPIPRSTR